MPIVTTVDTRNSQWANDPSSFGRKMLTKMGWKGDGSGLGKTQQGTSTHLRAVKRAESLGIGAENDAFGERGWQDTNAGFHNVLANLKREYSSSSTVEEGKELSMMNNECNRSEEGDANANANARIKGKKEKARTKSKKKDYRTNDGTIRLPQNKVQAGHARKMREAKDIRNKSAVDMAAIFGIKAEFYQKPREWKDDSTKKNELENTKKCGNDTATNGRNFVELDITSSDVPAEEETKSKSKRNKKKKKSKTKVNGDIHIGKNHNDENEIDAKKRKRKKEEGTSVSKDHEVLKKKKKKKKKSSQ